MARQPKTWRRRLQQSLGMLVSMALAGAVTLFLFLILPLLENVGKKEDGELEVRSVDSANLPPPPPPPPEEPEQEKEEEEPPPPDMSEQAQPLDLSQLELALNPGMGEGGGDFAVRLPGAGGGKSDSGEDVDAIFSMADLDQAPRVVHQPPPDYPAELRRKKMAGTVYILFVVDKDGRVANPIVQKSTHPAFETPALQAVKKWRFEPGKRKGKAVQFKMRVPITFSKG